MIILCHRRAKTFYSVTKSTRVVGDLYSKYNYCLRNTVDPNGKVHSWSVTCVWARGNSIGCFDSFTNCG